MFFQPSAEIIPELGQRLYHRFNYYYSHNRISQMYITSNNRICYAVTGEKAHYNGVYVDNIGANTLRPQLQTGNVGDISDDGIFWEGSLSSPDDYGYDGIKFYDDYAYGVQFREDDDKYFYFYKIGPLSGTPSRTNIYTHDLTTEDGFTSPLGDPDNQLSTGLQIDYLNGKIYYQHQWVVRTAEDGYSEFEIHEYDPSTDTNTLLVDHNDLQTESGIKGICYDGTGTYVYFPTAGTSYYRVKLSDTSLTKLSAPNQIYDAFGKGFFICADGSSDNIFESFLYNLLDDTSYDLSNTDVSPEINRLKEGFSIIGDSPPYYTVLNPRTRNDYKNSRLTELQTDGTIDNSTDYDLMYVDTGEDISSLRRENNYSEWFHYYPSNPEQYGLIPTNYCYVSLMSGSVS